MGDLSYLLKVLLYPSWRSNLQCYPKWVFIEETPSGLLTVDLPEPNGFGGSFELGRRQGFADF